MAKIIKLPTAATSYYTIHKAGHAWDVVLVTPCGNKPIRTALYRLPDRESAMAYGEDIAGKAMRPFKARAS